MSCASGDERIRAFCEFAREQGFPEELFFGADNLDRYIATALDGYRTYPLFLHVFGGRYDERTLGRMMTVDFKYRLHNTAGITSSDAYESVLLFEPPATKKTGLLQYVRTAEPSSFTLLLEPAMYRQEIFERYARKRRKPFLDDRTWYLYLFATRQDCQHRGYGKKLMNLMISYADRTNSRLCLETNLEANTTLYEHFGFRLADSSVYRGTLSHYVMLYGG